MLRLFHLFPREVRYERIGKEINGNKITIQGVVGPVSVSGESFERCLLSYVLIALSRW